MADPLFPPPKPASTGGGETPELLVRSAVSAATKEMLGLDPSPEVARVRRDNPFLGMASQFAGIAVPYWGWAKVARLGKLGKAVQGIELSGPVRTEALREIARFAPLEAGRIGGSLVVGGDVGEVSVESLINLGLAGGIGGAVALFKSSGPRVRNFLDGTLGNDLKAPPQIQLRQVLQKMATETDPVRLEKMKVAASDLGRAVRIERPPGRYVGDLEMGGDRRLLNRMFNAPVNQRTTTLTRKKFYVGAGDGSFDTQAELRKVAQNFGLGAEWEQFVQFPTYTRGKGTEGFKIIRRNLEGMEAVGDGWYLTREAPDGLFVMAKVRKPNKLAGEGGISEALIFKTDTPGRFVKRARKEWADRVSKLHADWPELTHTPKPGARLYNEGVELTGTIPAINYIDDVLQNKGVKGSLKRLGGRPAQKISDFFTEYLAPTQFQFGGNPRAKWVHGIARAIFDRARARSEAVLYGRPVSRTSGKGLFADIFSGTSLRGGLINADEIEKLTPDDLAQLGRMWSFGIPVEEAAALGFSERALQMARKVQTYDEGIIREIAATESATRAGVRMRPLPEQLRAARLLKGDYRANVLNEAGAKVAIASGRTPKEALEEADTLIREASAAQDLKWRRSDWYLSGREEDLGHITSLAVKNPDFLLANELKSKLLGTKLRPRAGAPEAPWSKDELRDIIARHVNGQQNYLANLVARDLLTQQMNLLKAESPLHHRAVAARLDDLAGKPGPAAEWINRQADRALGPYLGKDSASKIVSAANGAMFHLMLGMGNLQFVALNALTFLHTTLPHTAFVLGGSRESLHRYYTWLPALNASGAPVGQAGTLEPLKMMWRAMKEMGKPDASLQKAFTRAGVDGVWDPRFVEEWVGQTSRSVKDFRSVLSEPRHFAGWIKDLSSWGPAQSEKFARGHAFVTGHILGRDFLGLADDQLYMFAKEFTENTMFLYGTADRARLITGPIGSLFGLFKNWQMHYMGWTMQYADEALARKNWAPLLWMQAGTWATAGTAGLPLYAVVDGAQKLFTDESLMEKTYEMFDPEVADGVYMGLPAFLGVSMQSSAAAPGADPARDASMLLSLAYTDRAKAVGTMLGAGFEHYARTGEHPISSPEARDAFVKAFAPKFLYRGLQVWEGNYIRSLNTGRPLVRDVQAHERALYALGFMPTRAQKTFEVADQLWKEQEALRARTQFYGEQYAQAQLARDFGALREVMRNALADGVDISSVMRSASTRVARERSDILESRFEGGELRGRFRDILG